MKVQTEEKDIVRDMSSKALLPTSRSREYREFRERRRLEQRISRMEKVLDHPKLQQFLDGVDDELT